MSSRLEKFKNLHKSSDLFVLPNAWNAKSAFLFQEEGFPAIATSSAAVAASLGYEDGEAMPFYDYLFVIDRVLSSIRIPLSVDLEMGYGASDDAIYANILKLVEKGVAGINLEDSVMLASGRVLKDADKFAKTIEYVRNRLASAHADLFINVRCDTYILNVADKRQETNRRLKLYESTGADGIFLPCICAADDIAEAVKSTILPLNVMCIPGLPDFEILNDLGVKRLSMGPFLFNKVYDQVAQLSRATLANKSFAPILQ